MPVPEIFLEGAIHPFNATHKAEIPAGAAVDFGRAAPSGSIAFDLQQQRQEQWCWAAVAVSISVHYDGTNLSQCELAKTVLNDNTCCQSEPSCNQQAPLSTALQATGNLANGPVAPLDFADVKNEIDQVRLVCCRMEKETGHFLVLSGYREDLSEEWVDVQDPWGDTFASMAYAKFLNQHERGPCTHAYFTEPK